MNKQAIKQKLTTQYGDFVCVNEFASFMRIDRGTARQMLAGLSYISCGRKKLYFAEDIAERLMESRQ